MIPTFNCAHLLGKTLLSVLSQDLGVDRMQIEVIDDCSTKDDPEAIVKEVGKGRVEFHRKVKNEGSTANFNTCIERSRGHLVHILHGDDWVLPGFYEKVETVAREHPEQDVFSVRPFTVSENGEVEILEARVRALENPSLASSRQYLRETFYYENTLRTPALVARRSFYETAGGFHPSLNHVADWEMWIRAAWQGKLIFINEVLACYRLFNGNETGRLAKTGENILDYARLGGILAARDSHFDPARYAEMLSKLAAHQVDLFKSCGDEESAARNVALWEQLNGRPFTRKKSKLTGTLNSVIRRFLRQE